MDGLVLFAIAAAYVSALFALAYWAENRRGRWLKPRYRIPAYTLALAVYCTSWTFYGAVGSAVADGWLYLPIYLGPILIYLFGRRFLERLVETVQREGATSIADFIGSRFGKSRTVAALVTLLALLGTIPYLALQLRSVGTSFAEFTGTGSPGLVMGFTAAMLALFAMLFGTRRYEAAGRNDGVLFAVGVESLVKLTALVAAGVFAGVMFMGLEAPVRASGLAALGENFAPAGIGIEFLVVTLLSMAAIVCLPRQFYIGVIEAASVQDVRRSRLPFVAYLVVTSLVVIPIALAATALVPAGTSADLLLLDMPLAAGADALAILVFIGGFSAATGMAIVESVALSTMVSNDLIAPLLLRSPRWANDANLGRVMLTIRRIVIASVMAGALAYTQIIPAGERLAAIGLIAFAAMAQFAPSLVLAVSRAGRDATAAKAGLSTGLVLWVYTLFIPAVVGAEGIAPLAGTLADPNALLGIEGLSPLVHGTLWSLGLNIAVHAIVAARRIRSARVSFDFGDGVARVSDLAGLANLVERFVGTERTAAAFGDAPAGVPVGRASAQMAERMIAGVVGAPSARALVASALSGSTFTASDVALMLDESSGSLQFSKDLLAATLEHIDPGVSVIDSDLNLVAWNSRYLDLFEYPPGMVRVGAPVAELIRHNALRGECGPGEVDDHVQRRLDHMQRGSRHSFERVRPDGRVIKTVGGPMPRGGYVMCFTDITAEAEARTALEQSRAELEIRVEQRTAELSQANVALAQATREKTRFLAAASHDLLQPLHAARLFAAALDREVSGGSHVLVDRIDQSIDAAEQLLRTLLDISKLDAGGFIPTITSFPLKPLLLEVAETFHPMAAEKGLTLRIGGIDATLETDRTLLRSIVQNLLSNAIRYTAHGGIVVGARRRGGRARIDVVDTGAGIPEDKQDLIFREFERLGTGGEAGVGLGLAIVDRAARHLGAKVDLASVQGRGSRFSVTFDLADAEPPLREDDKAVSVIDAAPLHLLVVDDDLAVCEAMTVLGTSRGHRVTTANDPEAALAQEGPFDVALVDFQLGADMDGIDLIAQLRARHPGLRAALVTADRSPETPRRAAALGISVLAKPLAATTLDAWLAGAAEETRAA
ncbi:PAS-domain containing protein [uncultured Sphingosinicella sp.]|uniref:PAS-domain containing protein n=1 Tax=uncultured Sphingosinicella sp. TaxID=478748 RepID=UPI0030DB6941|tara:strand:+ start:31637 stop:34978 length:3342 start_codon:yes stop_codon:yes gene_type:complete